MKLYIFIDSLFSIFWTVECELITSHPIEDLNFVKTAIQSQILKLAEKINDKLCLTSEAINLNATASIAMIDKFKNDLTDEVNKMKKELSSQLLPILAALCGPLFSGTTIERICDDMISFIDKVVSVLNDFGDKDTAIHEFFCGKENQATIWNYFGSSHQFLNGIINSVPSLTNVCG